MTTPRKKAPSRGGKREGAGVKPADPEKPNTETVAFKTNPEQAQFIKENGGAVLLRQLVQTKIEETEPPS